MAGTITKRGNKLRLQYMCKGNRYSKTIPMMSNKDAEKELAKFIAEIDKGNFVNTSYTFFEFSQIWLSEVIKPNSSPVTLKNYIAYLNNRILPYLGNYKLTELNTLILNSFFNELKQQKTMYKYRENVPIAKGTIQKVQEIVSGILQKAYEFELINNNPCRKIKLQLDNIESEINKTEAIMYFDVETYKKVMELIKTEPLKYRILIEVAAKTGLRRSEIYGLTASDIDLKNKTISVNKSRHYVKDKGMMLKNTKTKSSKRTITIPNSLAILLEEYMAEYTGEYIFEEISINAISTWWKNWQRSKDIQPIRFHDLRHTHATLLLSQGIDLKTISQRLGHSNISRTMNTYAHVLKEMDMKASNVMDNL